MRNYNIKHSGWYNYPDIKAIEQCNLETIQSYNIWLFYWEVEDFVPTEQTVAIFKIKPKALWTIKQS